MAMDDRLSGQCAFVVYHTRRVGSPFGSPKLTYISPGSPVVYTVARMIQLSGQCFRHVVVLSLRALRSENRLHAPW